MDVKRMRGRVLIIALGLLILTMSFTGFVNYMTFEKNFNAALAKTYSVAGNEIVREIEYALKYGKPIDNYYGMNETLGELKDLIPQAEEINLVTPNGDILYDLNGFVQNAALPSSLHKAAVFEEGQLNDSLGYRFHDQTVYMFIRISDAAGSHIASLVMTFPDAFLQFSSLFVLNLMLYLAGIAVLAMAVLAIIFLKTKSGSLQNLVNKNKVLLALIIVIGLAQLSYSAVNYSVFKDAYQEMAYMSEDFIEDIVGQNIQGITQKGLELQNIEGIDAYLQNINDDLPQIEQISLVAADSLDAQISQDYINQQMKKILLDMLTVLIISIFFMIEITLLAVNLMNRNLPGVKPDATADDNDEGTIRSNHGVIRAAGFFINMCACMALTFVPIVMKELYQPLFGLSRDVVLGLPLSAEMLGGILAIILAGMAINKRGWRTILYWGLLFLGFGNLLSGLSDNAFIFITARAVAGFGLAYVLMSVRSLVVSMPENNLGIAEFSAGAIAGLNCGAVIGGMLADQIGYAAVFFIAVLLTLIPFILVKRLMAGFAIKARKDVPIPMAVKLKVFFSSRKALLFVLCIFIPYFVSGAFLDYYFPLFAADNALSQSDISRGVLLNGLFIIYLGPVLTKFVTSRMDSGKGLVFSMFIVICALANFMLFGTVAAAFITLILLGIAESFGVSLKTTYFLDLPGVKDMEVNQGIACFSAMVNFSRMAGPILFGIALSVSSTMGVGLIALMLLLLLLVFIFFAGKDTVQISKAG